MNARLFEARDLDELEAIHKKYYRNSFPFPLTSKRKLLNKFVIEDDNGEILTFGALELSAEVLALTNKGLDIKLRRAALYALFQALLFDAGKHNFPMIHCSVDDLNWERHLEKVGWKQCKGKMLYCKV